MARSTAQIQADIDALRATIGSGVTTVRYGDREVRYDSAEGKLAALKALQDELAAVEHSQPSRIVRVYTSSGWGC